MNANMVEVMVSFLAYGGTMIKKTKLDRYHQGPDTCERWWYQVKNRALIPNPMVPTKAFGVVDQLARHYSDSNVI